MSPDNPPLSLTIYWNDPKPEPGIVTYFNRIQGFSHGDPDHDPDVGKYIDIGLPQAFGSKPSVGVLEIQTPRNEIDVAPAVAESYPISPADIPDLLLLAGECEASGIYMCPVMLDTSLTVLLFPVWKQSRRSGPLLSKSGAFRSNSLKFRLTSVTGARQWWTLGVTESDDIASVQLGVERPLRWWLERLSFKEPERWRIVL